MPAAIAFDDLVGPPDAQGCRDWLGALDWYGYGYARLDGRPMRAHRAAWVRVHGPIPPGKCVLHTCERQPCVEDSHLYLGTRAEVALARVLDGRSGATGPKGLTPDDVRAIRTSSASQRVMAQRYRVSQAMISQIRTRRAWASID